MTDAPVGPTDAKLSGTVLHIGTMKSGTSYLQDVLANNAPALSAAGVDYLGRGTRAVWDILSLREAKKSAFSGQWDRVVRDIKRSPARVQLLSMELLSTATPEQIAAIAQSLEDVRVVVTARDIARLIPSAWQNVIKHASTKSFPDFVAALMADRDSRTKERFWRQQDLAAIVRGWSDVFGVDNVYVVTVPPSGAPSTMLWERFCSVLGVPPLDFDPVAKDANFSLTYSDAELLRQINDRVRGKLGDLAYNRYVRVFLANDIMRPKPAVPSEPGEPAAVPSRPDVPALGPEVHAWAVEQSERLVNEVRATGVHVVGDLAELIPRPFAGEPGIGPGTPPDVVYPDTAVRAMAHLIKKLNDVDPELDRSAPVDRKRAKVLAAREERAKRRMERDRRSLDLLARGEDAARAETGA